MPPFCHKHGHLARDFPLWLRRRRKQRGQLNQGFQDPPDEEVMEHLEATGVQEEEVPIQMEV